MENYNEKLQGCGKKINQITREGKYVLQLTTVTKTGTRREIRVQYLAE